MAKIDRREFLQLVGAGGVGSGVGFILAESARHPVEYLIPSAVTPEEYSPGVAVWYNSVCSMCPAGCGISVRTREGRPKKIEGNASHPVSQGRLCARGHAGLQVLYNPDRLIGPLARTAERGSGSFAPTTWGEGLSEVAERLRALQADGQADRICLLSSGVRGHLAELLELFMARLGSPRLMHYDFAHPQTLYAANERLFGERQLPYYDLRNTRYLLSFGADYLGGWISPVHHGLGFGHSRQGRDGDRGRFVQIEPRMSLSGAAADEWVPASPGTEGLLALALAQHIVATGRYRGADREQWSSALAQYEPAQMAAQTGVAAPTITRLAESFADTDPSLAIGGGSVGAHTNGVDTLVAVNALNYLAGSVGSAGGLVFNPAPAFGGIAQSNRAGYRAMLELAEHARDGRIEVLIVNEANPLFTLPAAAGFDEVLERIPLIVSLSSFMDETTAMADLVLPSHTYLESWGDDCPEPGVGFTVAAISQPVVSPLYDTRATGDIVLDLARRAGLDDALPWPNMEEFLRQRWQEIHARSAPEQPDAADDAEVAEAADVAEDTEDAETAAEAQTEQAAQDFESFWRSVLIAGVWREEVGREQDALTLDAAVIDSIGVAAPEFDGASDAYPFILHPYPTTGLDDGRGANLPWLQELPDPLTSVVYGSWVELNPATAAELGLADGDLVEVESTQGRIAAPVCIYPAIRPDVIAMPIGQGHTEYGRYAANRGVNPIRIIAPMLEPGTGSLAWGATRVRLVPTGRRATLVKTAGHDRELGRGIVQRTAATTAADASARLNSIPISVESI